jgi:hypothetical protein
MAVAKPEVLISQLLFGIGTKFPNYLGVQLVNGAIQRTLVGNTVSKNNAFLVLVQFTSRVATATEAYNSFCCT